MAKIKKINLKNTVYDIDVNKDWNQNDDDSTGYIANRTHYTENNGTVHQLDAKYIPIATGTALKVIEEEGVEKLGVDQLTANNVVFTHDLRFTKEFGYYGTEGQLKSDLTTKGNYTIPAAGQSINTILSSAFAKDTNPTIKKPEASFDFTNTGEFEVGSTVTPTVNIKLNNLGSFPYGIIKEDDSQDFNTKITGAYWSKISHGLNSYTHLIDYDKNTEGNVITLTYSAVNIESVGIVTTAKAKITYTGATNTPSTALGNKYDDGKFSGGTIEQSSNITGFRRMFFRTYKNEDKFQCTSSQIRPSTINDMNAPKVSEVTDHELTIDGGTTHVCIALPEGYKLTKVIPMQGLQVDIATSFIEQDEKVSINGAGNTCAANYTAYVLTAADGLSTNTYKITISEV